jgi:hypothetical protein
LVERALLNSSKAGDIVADLFGGSGSTLIGCERRGRKARLMEIDPKYADCICRRYQEYTGQKATLDADGRMFDENALEHRHERKSSAAAAKSLLSKRNCSPAIPTWLGSAWRSRIGRLSCGFCIKMIPGDPR